jgi:hypothetical protein
VLTIPGFTPLNSTFENKSVDFQSVTTLKMKVELLLELDSTPSTSDPET